MEQSDLDLLQTVPSYHLQTLLKMRRVSPPREQGNSSAVSTSSDTAEIAEQLFAPNAIAEALDDLSDLEQHILCELVACGGRANSRDLALYLTKSRILDGGRLTDTLSLYEQESVIYPTAHPHGPYEQALHRLLVKGLIFWGRQTDFAGRDYTNGVYDGVLIVPHAVRYAVRDRFLKEPESRELSPEEDIIVPFEEIDDGIRVFQRTLYLYWSAVAAARDGLPVVGSGLLARSALRQVAEQLGDDASFDQARSEADAPRLLFIRLLLMHLGLLRVRDNAVVAARAEEFFALPLMERARRCVRAWLESSFWNELAYLPNVVARPGPLPLEAAHDEAVRARRLVVERLQREQPETWQDIAAFIARAKLYAPHLLFPRQYGARADRYSTGSNPYGWDFRLRHGWLTHREGWHMVEGGFIRAVLFGPLHWLGLVETKLEAHTTQFRFSPHLSLLSKDGPPIRADIPWGKLIVQPNFELIALAPVSEALLIKLDRFAERVQLEHIAQYRLSKASVIRAIQVGHRADDILGVLQEAVDPAIDIPQNVRYSLAEWERQARRVEMWQNAALIEVDDPALLDTLFEQDETRALLRRRLSPVLAETVAHRLPELQRSLWERRYLPALTPAPEQDALGGGERPETRGPQWLLRDDGFLQPLHAVTDLYLAAEVAPFTASDEQTGWRKITPVSIRQAIEAGLTLNDIIRFLQEYCQHGIPSSFLICLKLWGGGYGEQSSIAVERMPMLYLSEQALQDIQADEALSALLASVVPSTGRLVRVPPEHLDQVIALLRERGFTVE